MKKAFFLSTVALLSLGALSACNADDGLTIKVWCDENVVASTTEILDAYKEAHSDFNYRFKIEPVGEGAAAGNMITDPSAGADVFFFAQDQLARLVTAKVISALPDDAKATVVSEHDAASVAAASSSSTLYSYPVTPNTFFLYYDKSVVKDPTDIDKILADCKTGSRYFYMDIANAWYNAAFFYAAGAKSEWVTDKKGNFTDYDDTYVTKGEPAMKEMWNLSKNANFKIGSAASAFSSSTAKAGAVVSGTWDKNTAKDALGNNFGVAVLPSWKVGTNTYKLKPFTGYKLIGTKPQTSEERANAVAEVALALSTKEAELKRFEALGWRPTNKEAQKNKDVVADAVSTVTAAQMLAGTPQGQYPGGWWDLAKALGAGLDQKAESDLADMLDTYNEGLEGLLS